MFKHFILVVRNFFKNKPRIKLASKRDYDISLLVEFNNNKANVMFLKLSLYAWFTDFTYESINHDIEHFLETEHGIKAHQIVMRVYEDALTNEFKK